MTTPSYATLTHNGLWKNNPALVQLLGLCPLLAVVAATGYSCVSAQVFNYDDAYPGVDYSSRPLEDRLTMLMAQIESGEVILEHDAEGRGYLDALLEASP